MNDFSDMPPPDMPPPPAVDDGVSLTSDQYEEFLDALDLLYIKSNLSGRLKFLENWPSAARKIFGDELIGFDHDGTTDVEYRVSLEVAAEERRVEFLEVVQTLEEKSAIKNVLQVEYVENLVKELGRDIALLLYSEKIVNRFIPAPSGLEAGAAVGAVVADMSSRAPRPSDIPDEFADAPAPVQAVPEIDDSMDDIQPISLDPTPSDPTVAPPPAPPPPPEPDVYEEPQSLEEAMKELQEKKAAEAAAASESAAPDTPQSADASAIVESPAPDLDQPVQSPPPVPSPVASPSDANASPAPASLDAGVEDVAKADMTEPSAPPVESPPAIEPSAPDTVSVMPRGGPPPSDPTVQDVSARAKHKALDDAAPIASQKMTFVPSKSPTDGTKSPAVPVVGEKKDDEA